MAALFRRVDAKSVTRSISLKGARVLKLGASQGFRKAREGCVTGVGLSPLAGSCVLESIDLRLEQSADQGVLVAQTIADILETMIPLESSLDTPIRHKLKTILYCVGVNGRRFMDEREPLTKLKKRIMLKGYLREPGFPFTVLRDCLDYSGMGKDDELLDKVQFKCETCGEVSCDKHCIIDIPTELLDCNTCGKIQCNRHGTPLGHVCGDCTVGTGQFCADCANYMGFCEICFKNYCNGCALKRLIMPCMKCMKSFCLTCKDVWLDEETSLTVCSDCKAPPWSAAHGFDHYGFDHYGSDDY